MAAEREVIFEFLRVGAALKVTAVDAATGIEAVIVGDPKAGDAILCRLARQKLHYVMNRKKG
ncbi:MAG TPA: hypothetical protein VNF99_16740 [Stellaceae bacterium]|nr:hypothetical protein [Stellaceae bacterium]